MSTYLYMYDVTVSRYTSPSLNLGVHCISTGHLSGHRRSNSAQLPGKMVFHQSSSSTSNSTTTPTSGSQDMGSIDSQGGVGMAMGGVKGKNGVIQCSSGSFSVDRALIQHLIHCESLLVVS